MQRFLLILLLVLVAAGFATAAKPDTVTAEEYSVYSALIVSKFLHKTTTLAVIKANTEFDINAVSIPKAFDADFQTKIGSTSTLKRHFQIDATYLLLTANQLDVLFKGFSDEGWEAYWKKYPHATGLLTFSRVGFSAQKNKAFVYAHESCGPRCGDGSSFLLEKENGSWKVKEEKQLWIS